MSNFAKWSIGILAAVLIAGLIWYFSKKKMGDNSSQLQPPPTATPPISGISGLQSTTQGAGGLAVKRRIDEILNSSEGEAIQNEVQSQVDILKGVTPSKASYYNQNISQNGITSARKVPFNLSALQKNALSAFSTIDLKAGKSTAENLRVANVEMFSVFNTSFVGQPERQSTQDFIFQVFCQNYEDCGKGYRDAFKPEKLLAGGEKAGADMALISGNWIYGANAFETKVQLKAIEDLRAAGWKFEGFDAV